MRAIYKKELKSHCVGVSGVFLGADRIVFLPV